MTSFKRWFGAGAIVLVALALIACPAMLPTVADEIGDMKFGAGDIGEAKTVSSLGDYFNARDNATYDASSSDVKVATASVAGTTLTVTAKGPGTATVTVTAKDRDGTVTQRFSVTVAEPPDPPVNNPPVSKTIVDVPLQMGDTKMLTLSKYYTDSDGDALTYTAASGNEPIATVSKPDDATSMITITAVAAGTATITVSANDGTNAAVPQTFDVTVTAKPDDNERPELRLRIEDQSLTIVDAPTLAIDLTPHFLDPDHDPLTFDASSNAPNFATEMVDGSTLTITAVAPGMAKIEVTATDGRLSVSWTFQVTVNEESNKAPIVVPGSSRDVVVTVGGAAKVIDLSVYFADPHNDPLDFDAESSDDEIATVNDPDPGSMITITAVAAGMAEIKVTATDDGGLSASLDLMVQVLGTPNVAPVVDLAIRDQSLEMDFDMTATIDLSLHFSDSEDNGPSPLTYDHASSDGMVATAMVDGSMLTITAVAAGTTAITVTASDGADQAEAMFTVTVSNPPVPTSTDDLPDAQFDHDDMDDRTHKLSEYFSGATKYKATSSNPSVVKAAEADGVLTLTPAGPGQAVVTVTPSNSGGSGTAQTITVTVDSVPAPTVKKPLRDLDPFPSDDAAKTITLSEYFSGANIKYDVRSTNLKVVTVVEEAGVMTLTPVSHGAALVTVTPSNSGGFGTALTTLVTVQARPVVKAGSLVLVDRRMETDDPALPLELKESFDDPDGTIVKYGAKSANEAVVKAEVTATTLTLTPVKGKTGTVVITVTATDDDGLVTEVTFEVVAVAKNNDPKIEGAKLLKSYTNENRLKVGDTKSIEEAFNKHFSDADINLAIGDLLTFKVKNVATSDGPLKDDAPFKAKDAVATATISPTEWNGGPGKFTVTVEANKAGPAHDILIIATDLSGVITKDAYKVISVQVNHAPKATSGDKALGKYTDAKGLGAGETGAKTEIDLNAYFSDVDKDELNFIAVPSVTGPTAPAKVKVVGSKLTLDVAKAFSTEFVEMTVTVYATDGFENSSSETFTVSVTHPGKVGSVR